MLSQEYIRPHVQLAPQEAFYAASESLILEASRGRICSEFVMCYPPGIPVLAPGEEITSDIIEYITYAKAKGCFLTGTRDSAVRHLQVIKE